MIELRFLRATQHQAHSTAVEECQSRWRFEEQLESQHILIKGRRALHIFCVDCYLSEVGNADSSRCCAHLLTSEAKLVSIANYIRCRKSSPKQPHPKPSHLGRKPSRPPTAFTPPPSTCCAAYASR